MKLTRLEMSGFKSFADTVTLEFERGVTAIVGPNGCGKSNVSDAVRWVLGEQSARLLRGGKMEDVIFQGAATRKPVNVAEVSLYLDNSDGQLAIAYQEVVITRRLSRSGQSDYLLNGQQVRLRDIQDLLRGTGLGSDAGVVIEAKMIELLLSDRAEERRSLFEEAAGIGLYRDRKQSTERRLAETAQDLQRVEDRINEAQTQVRSLARQKGKAERHQQLTQERFALEVTAAQRLTAQLAAEVASMEARREALAGARPAARTALAEAEAVRDELGRTRSTAEAERTEIVRRLGDERGRQARLEGDLKLAAERQGNLAAQRRRAEDARARAEAAARDAATEAEQAAAERAAAEAEAARIRGELARRALDEEAVRAALLAEREAVRQLELELQGHVQAARSLEGEREALTAELAQLRERAAHLATQRATADAELAQAERRRDHLVEQAGFRAQQARVAAETVQQARHLLNEVREHEAAERVRRRQAEELAAQLGARASALEELERDRVGLAPAAAALLAERSRFDGVVGPLSDFITIGRDGAELAERLLGDWMHAVLVRDAETVAAIRRWHESQDPGTLMLLPLDPGPAAPSADHPLRDRLQVEGAAVAWVDAILGGSTLLDASGIAVRRANGAILLPGRGATTGPLRRRAELAAIRDEQREAQAALDAVDEALRATAARLAAAEAAQQAAQQAADEAREAERLAVAAREDAVRAVAAASRELATQALDAQRVAERIARAERRLGEVDAALAEREQERVRLDGGLGTARSTLQEREAAQESAREQRVHWQVQEAQVTARLQAAQDRAQRAARAGAEAAAVTAQMGEELARIADEEARLAAQASEWTEGFAQARVAVLELEAAASDAERALADAIEALRQADAAVEAARERAEALGEESHQLDLRLAEAASRRRSVVERLETTWRRSLDELLAGFEPLDLDPETLEAELARVVSALEAIGQVNPLAVEEHAEESKRLAFLVAQRDDLVAARQSLLQAIREIDGTARALFLETFAAVQAHFQGVFQTLFGGGECELRLSDPGEPLDCEIEIHAAPRGKRTQRIHLLSSGERTLVATSLLFAIYLTKPSPFCLMDEVDAPLDDANVGRFTRLLDEFKGSTQFIVITHNPRTMQAADAVYGVTMQEPGVSTIVGVRLGQAAGAA